MLYLYCPVNSLPGNVFSLNLMWCLSVYLRVNVIDGAYLLLLCWCGCMGSLRAELSLALAGSGPSEDLLYKQSRALAVKVLSFVLPPPSRFVIDCGRQLTVMVLRRPFLSPLQSFTRFNLHSEIINK